ncbi:ABC transporter ATP-binding protein [Marinibactrum halimedae]|uniref:ABC transporter ATP-binding protein n=1 Tax=Marinibactrum halimedae TaxID=1444977 RepID=A0AA37WPN8_9GAMM|nr:ABC transporter ATP-binding protein [Marinibactrum halimedae]MCD9460138.1 ABC transporter ATP-binding protein/permease [Marinibactrum halimedae]GLS26392.1 ABC transporter ATP-binding protein [Marinibactrum halimedae]
MQSSETTGTPPKPDNVDLKHVGVTLRKLLVPELSYIKVVIVYGIAISLLTLAVPVAVQTLINTVANIASLQAIISLSGLLLFTLLISSALSALRTRVMESYERHLYARLTADISLSTLFARHDFFDGRKNPDVAQRYFDIMIFQRNVPSLVIDGFALVLQAIVGITLVSFYHSALFAFNLVLVALIYLIWLIWGRGAKRTAVMLSHAKYNTAKWLTDLTAAHEFFKSSRHIDFAMQRTEEVTAEYVRCHKDHFKYTFAQTVFFLLLYAMASAGLLGVGGWLVTRGELSIGQLVAAELILSAIFFGLSKFTNYLKLFYELYGAADELDLVLSVPQEEHFQQAQHKPEPGDLSFRKVSISRVSKAKGAQQCVLDFCLPQGSKVFALTTEPWLQRAIIHLLKLHQTPLEGHVRLAGQTLEDYKLQDLRQAIAVVDRSLIVECSISDYLRLAAPSASRAQMLDTLESVGLSLVLATLPKGLDTHLSTLGAPLDLAEFLLLKLAAALLSKPSILVMTQHFDNLPKPTLERVLDCAAKQESTVLFFSNNPDFTQFDYCLMLDTFINDPSELTAKAIGVDSFESKKTESNALEGGW